MFALTSLLMATSVAVAPPTLTVMTSPGGPATAGKSAFTAL